ncbi:hypothetical protein Pla52n_45120 [Stieleria varia]|uniref:Uncharacterized protein n=1 Tax=Stieleria varia TaxID=2528005 RepID=A0A5C6AN89_9BACT|nr:hypothetical protein Pla52n_45120 [Stieleria varia]
MLCMTKYASVKEGLSTKKDPCRDSLREWDVGSEDLLRRLIALAEEASGQSPRIDPS